VNYRRLNRGLPRVTVLLEPKLETNLLWQEIEIKNKTDCNRVRAFELRFEGRVIKDTIVIDYNEIAL
jgi:hypothetical protein